jgi:putative ABC transport system permease protein
MTRRSRGVPAGRARRSDLLTVLGLSRTRLHPADLLREAAISVLRYPGRSLLTAIGTVLGVAAFVAVFGLTSTVSQQVSAAFDTRRATEVLVQAEDAAAPSSWHSPTAVERLTRLNGVQHAGRRVTLPETSITRGAHDDTRKVTVKVMGLDARALQVVAPSVRAGRSFDRFHDNESARVVLLPSVIAAQLQITRTGVAVYIDGQPFTVMGILETVQRRPEVLLSAVIPFGAAETMITDLTGTVERDVLIQTAPGAAQIIGRQAPYALSPQAPEAVRAIAPPDPRTLRREVERNVVRSSLMVSVIALVVGAVSIGNTATAGVAARTAEIGLRRAIGGRPRHVFAQLLCETSALGGLGGLAGAALGVAVTVAVSMWNGWAPVLELRVAVLAIAVSAAAGLLAGMAPAIRAIRISPVAALQQ